MWHLMMCQDTRKLKEASSLPQYPPPLIPSSSRPRAPSLTRSIEGFMSSWLTVERVSVTSVVVSQTADTLTRDSSQIGVPELVKEEEEEQLEHSAAPPGGVCRRVDQREQIAVPVEDLMSRTFSFLVPAGVMDLQYEVWQYVHWCSALMQ